MSRSKEQWMEETGGLPLNFLLRYTRTIPAPPPLKVPVDRLIFCDTETLPIIFRRATHRHRLSPARSISIVAVERTNPMIFICYAETFGPPLAQSVSTAMDSIL